MIFKGIIPLTPFIKGDVVAAGRGPMSQSDGIRSQDSASDHPLTGINLSPLTHRSSVFIILGELARGLMLTVT